MTKHPPSYYFDLESYFHKSLFINCPFPWDALKNIKDYLETYPLGDIKTDVPKEAYLINPELISIGEETIIEPGAYIKGPCIIGKACTIRHGAYIRGNFITGDHCVIGHASEIKNTIFLNKTQAAHFAYVGDSILGNHTNLGAGTKCANLKLKGDTVRVTLSNEKINTGLRKFGAIIGDHVQIGCNCVTNPGTLIGKNSLIYPCISVGGVIKSQQIIQSN